MIPRHRLMLVACAALALPVPPAHAQKSPLAQAAYTRAQAHLLAGHFAEAAVEMETAVRYEPRFAMGWYVLASAARRAGRCDQAVFAYRRYMDLRPTEPDPFFGTGLCLQAVGDDSGATAAFRQYVALDLRPTSREFVEIARKHLSDLERTSTGDGKASPVAETTQLVEAREQRQRGRVDGAVASYRAAMAASPKSPQPYVELGALLVSARRPRDAVDVLRTAVKLAPASAASWYNLAFALRESGQAEDAVAAYRRYITFKPKDPDPYYGLARALTTVGRQDEALISFKLYTTLETRPTERQWVKRARAEMARIEGAQRQHGGNPEPHGPGIPPFAQPAPTAPVARQPSRASPSTAASTSTARPPVAAPLSVPPTQAPAPRQP